ncbi:hypothetical protein R3P38DRAFT_237825 [Favolaschia claudopus]|uniref:Uncharacterized protein n=1 Tax=Favolaschia claudopus TaxID=2862362 RepID=A0AAV9ZRD3_9AGAR
MSHKEQHPIENTAEFKGHFAHLFQLTPLGSPGTPLEYAEGHTPWWKHNHLDADNAASPAPPVLETYEYLPLHFRTISVPPQAKYLTVVPPEEEENVALRDRIPQPKGSKSRPANITVVPAARPVAVVTSHTPPPGAERRRIVYYVEGTPPPSPGRSPCDPAAMTGLPRALGMKALPVREDLPWKQAEWNEGREESDE